MMKLEGKAALVTGAGSGIGQAAAELFASAGASVAVVDLKLAAASATVDKITETGGQAVAIAADVSSAEHLSPPLNNKKKRLGRLDSLYNNAGVPA
ncbi:MAG: SDR family NAD(P)-dependent oxidoreductase, partial [Acidimicrobiia bacterium]|nr:SDR family NAD(P)-dependent oxidoreductase [Acidimicrobiia bacterium]